MSRDFGNYVTCGILAVLFIMFLPVVLLLIVVLAIVQLLTGRRLIRMNRWYQRQAEPEPPAQEELEREYARMLGNHEQNKGGSTT